LAVAMAQATVRGPARGPAQTPAIEVGMRPARILLPPTSREHSAAGTRHKLATLRTTAICVARSLA